MLSRYASILGYNSFVISLEIARPSAERIGVNAENSKDMTSIEIQMSWHIEARFIAVIETTVDRSVVEIKNSVDSNFWCSTQLKSASLEQRERVLSKVALSGWVVPSVGRRTHLSFNVSIVGPPSIRISSYQRQLQRLQSAAISLPCISVNLEPYKPANAKSDCIILACRVAPAVRL